VASVMGSSFGGRFLIRQRSDLRPQPIRADDNGPAASS
jgi:hypothetical protein